MKDEITNKLCYYFLRLIFFPEFVYWNIFYLAEFIIKVLIRFFGRLYFSVGGDFSFE